MDFTAFTNEWKVVGYDLTQTDVDRAFIATNFEEVDLENNNDKDLCRYELMEILSRIGKTKYYDTKVVSTVAEATKRILDKFIIPNSTEKMPW